MNMYSLALWKRYSVTVFSFYVGLYTFYCTFFFYLIWALPEINVIVLYCIVLYYYAGDFHVLYSSGTVDSALVGA